MVIRLEYERTGVLGGGGASDLVFLVGFFFLGGGSGLGRTALVTLVCDDWEVVKCFVFCVLGGGGASDLVFLVWGGGVVGVEQLL